MIRLTLLAALGLVGCSIETLTLTESLPADAGPEDAAPADAIASSDPYLARGEVDHGRFGAEQPR